MQTTLRIDDQLYREAKAEAAREGVTLTRFLEAALREKLGGISPARSGKPHPFPVYVPQDGLALPYEEMMRIAEEEENNFHIRKLGIHPDRA